MSRIEWTDATWNPTTGCDRVSPGCDNCYALTMSARLKAMGQAKYQTDGRPETSGPGFGVQTHPDTLDQPLRWRKPRRVFVNSMSDLFHPQVPDEFIARVFAVMGLCDGTRTNGRHHTFQVLTKRPARMRTLLSSDDFQHEVHSAAVAHQFRGYWPKREFQPFDYRRWTPWPLPNVWLGVSVEDQERAAQRIPQLLSTPAAVRFVSCEPLLGTVDLRTVPIPLRGPRELAIRRLDWVIIGGESGPGARPMAVTWARKIVRDCQAAGVAPFVKQLGSCWGRDHHDLDAFPPDLQVREYPQPQSVARMDLRAERATR